jgi:hypothetical protein
VFLIRILQGLFIVAAFFKFDVIIFLVKLSYKLGKDHFTQNLKYINRLILSQIRTHFEQTRVGIAKQTNNYTYINYFTIYVRVKMPLPSLTRFSFYNIFHTNTKLLYTRLNSTMIQ